jgi:cell division protein FtsI/penicillin-binding protein 2
LVRLERRVGILFFISLLLLSGILLRAVWLQGVEGSTFASQASSQQEDTITVPGLRGSILDRNGRELVGSELGASVYATPYQIKDPQQESADVAEALDADPAEVLEAITQPGGFSYIQRKVDLVRAGRVEKLELEGIGQHPDTLRTRPQGDLAAQVVGAVSAEGKGLTGIEAAEDTVLRGRDGEQHLVKDALGEPIEMETIRDPRDGKPVRLTIDAAIQDSAENALAKVAEAHDPVNASAIVMDARNSEVLAMANWPPVDLDNLDTASPEDLLNVGTSYNYEPGSTFKAFTVASALETGTVTKDSTFTLAPTLQIYDRVIEESHPRGTVTLDVGDILAQSSNVGSVTIGLQMGGERFGRWINRFGFGRPTGIEYPGEEGGIVIPYEDYSGSTMGNLPIGQGLAVTPIQMVAGYGALANDGILRPPRLIKSIGDRTVPQKPGRRVVSPEVATEVRQMLEGVLAPGGTAPEVEIPGYRLAGKTGTAEIATESGYSDSRFVASFIGMAPADDPRIVVSVMVSEPKNGYYGGEVAAPAFGDIASFALPYLGVPTE